MCGITGVFHFATDHPVDRALLERSTDVIAHRGPDGRGTYVDGSVGLGHRRLAIIDTTDAASQPLSNEDGSVWIVFNGEIYNFQSLKAELEKKGHRFHSRSDTETIVHLYEEMGERVVERLRGMFALAIWDKKKQQLFLARDRVGKKPLHYWTDGQTFRFGSEIKAIVEDPGVPREPDLQALSHYMTLGYVPSPETAFKNIRKLPPAHTLTVSRDGQLRVKRYWELSMGPKRTDGLDKIAEEILETLDEATKLRMISDVPLGAFLSGGIDSSAVVASMQRVSSTPVRTFAVGFEEKAWDESAYARLVAQHVKTDHTELVVRPDSLEGIEKLAWHYNEPFADSSLLPTSAVSKLARSKVTVALSGDGGDEVFVGYGRYTGMRVEERLDGLPAPLRAFAKSRAGIALLRGLGVGAMNGLTDQLHAARWRSQLPMVDRYFCQIETISPQTRQRVVAQDMVRALGGHDPQALLRERIEKSDGETWTEKCAHADFTTYLPDDICVKVDVASMAYGLETRAPLLDHVLVEKVAQLPFALKMRGLTGKWVLREALRSRLPETTLTRKKMGFGVPIEVWFKGGFSKLLEDMLLDKQARERGILDPKGVRGLIDEHKARGGQQYALFTLLMLEVWFRQWIDVAKPVAQPVSV